MQISVKKLQGGECFVQVEPSTLISEIKRQVSQALGIPIEEQKLLLVGRTLSDDQSVESYPTIKEGTRLNLVVKKPDGIYEAGIKYFKKYYSMNEIDAKLASSRLLVVVGDKINKMSLDDLERLCYDCLQIEQGRQPVTEMEDDCEDTFSM